MFEKKDFVSHSGLLLHWKINCDSLTDEDVETLAYIISEQFCFSSVHGVPTGGVRLAKALESFCTINGPRLVVDDVLITGKSMEFMKVWPDDIGVVIFARGECPSWVTPLFWSNF